MTVTIKTERPNGRKRVQFKSNQPTKTEQSHENETNINKIIKRYQKTGMLPISNKTAMYGDFTGSIDYHEANNRIATAKTNFLALPSDLRKRFDNDPGKLLDFLQDENNRQEAIELGLIPKPVPNHKTEPPVEDQKTETETE